MAIFTSTYHTKLLYPWPNSSCSHVMNYSKMTACVKGSCSHLKTTWALIGIIQVRERGLSKSGLFNFCCIKHMYYWTADVVIKWCVLKLCTCETPFVTYALHGSRVSQLMLSKKQQWYRQPLSELFTGIS